MGLLNILNGINIANQWTMYAATRAYLKTCILGNLELCNFSKYLGSQPLQEDWTTLELIEIIRETVTLIKVLRKNVVIVIFKKNVFVSFYIL